MKRLVIDIETASDLDLTAVGVHKYREHPSTKILLTAWCEIVDGKPTPVQIVEGTVRKEFLESFDEIWAYNAQFERVMLDLPLRSIRCAMILNAYYGHGIQTLGGASADRCQFSKFTQAGKRLIRLFSSADRKSKEDEPEMWQEFVEYCKRDVESTAELILSFKNRDPYELRGKLWRDYRVGESINDYGMPINLDVAKYGFETVRDIKAKAVTKLTELTGIDSINKKVKLRNWFRENGMPDCEGVGEKSRAAMLEQIDDLLLDVKKSPVELDVPALEKCYEVLTLLDLSSGSSFSKYEKAIDMSVQHPKDSDRFVPEFGLLRGQFQFYGGHTGRYSGRGIQPQNFPKGDAELDYLRKSRFYATTEKELRDSMRTLVESPEGDLLVSDYTAIEAFVTAWFAGEQWLLDAYTSGKDVYQAMGSRIDRKPFEECGKGTKSRTKGKIAVLGCGYGIGAPRLCAQNKGLPLEEAETIINDWRKENSHIVSAWGTVETSFRFAVQNPETSFTNLGCTWFGYRDNLHLGQYAPYVVAVNLPSGRTLFYNNVRIEDGDLYFNTKTKIWGGHMVENIVQALAWDILAKALLECRLRDYPVIMHVHDEIVLDGSAVSKGITLSNLVGAMTKPIPWMNGLSPRAAGYSTPFYRKD